MALLPLKQGFETARKQNGSWLLEITLSRDKILHDSWIMLAALSSTAVKRPKRFSFYLVGFYLILSGNMGKDV